MLRLLLMPFRFIFWLLVMAQKGFWYGRYYWRLWWPRLKPHCMRFWRGYGRPLVPTLGLGLVLTAFMAGLGLGALGSVDMVRRATDKQAPSCIWEASNGKQLPNTMGHQILEVDVMQGANPKVFRDFNDILLKVQPILEKENPVIFAPNQYDIFYDKAPHFTRDQAASILRSIRYATQKCGFHFCASQLLFSDGIRTRKIDCDTSAFLYISIGELYNLPIKPVTVPGHMFVRFYLDRTHYLNFNTNGYLTPIPNDYYIKEYHPSNESMNEGIHMQAAGYRTAIAEYYAYVGVSGKRHPGESMKRHLLPFLRKALQEDPQAPFALHLARICGYVPQKSKTTQALTPAIKEK